MTGRVSGWFGRTVALSVAVGLVFGVVAYRYLVEGVRVLQKYPPALDARGLAVSLVLAVAGYALVRALRPSAAAERPFDWAALRLPGTLYGAMFGTLAATMVVMLVEPTVFAVTVREGQFLSIATEVVFIAALWVLARTALAVRRVAGARVFGLRPAVLVWLMFLGVAVVLGEEMSWGQHWLGWGTPELFEGNLQRETNLHNFYTHRFEAAYYSVAVLLLVLVPYAWPQRAPRLLAPLAPYIPPPSMAVLALPLCGLMYNSWNFAAYQLWFFAGLWIALDLWRHAPRREALAAAAMGGLLAVSQAVFVLFGGGMAEGHELTEIREFLIAIVVWGYALMLAGRLRAMAAASAGRSAALGARAQPRTA